MVGLNKLKSSTSWPFPPLPWAHDVLWIEPDKNNPCCVICNIHGQLRSWDSSADPSHILFYFLIPFFLCLIPIYIDFYLCIKFYAIFDHLFIKLGIGNCLQKIPSSGIIKLGGLYFFYCSQAVNYYFITAGNFC